LLRAGGVGFHVRSGKMSNMVLLMTKRRMSGLYGFRSAFRDSASERTNLAREDRDGQR